MLKGFYLCTIMLLFIMIAGISGAHNNFSSAGYICEEDLIDNGSGNAGSTGFNLLASAGQSAQGAVSSSSFIINAGFYRPIPANPSNPDDTNNPPAGTGADSGGGSGGGCFINTIND